ncbi:MAG TPA: AMP-binding protein [Pedomonas sp.]|uniref:class I adenylate-forming enzyme family protein n=1 Tax=Pedomonas sp. TaxID=2976421 RepID=UPI002F3F37B6
MSAVATQSAPKIDLTAPGAPFEIIEADVRGHRMPVFAKANYLLSGLFARMATYGDRTFVVEEDRRTSYAQGYGQAAAIAALLRDQYGVKPGDRVAINMRNRLEWMTGFMAVSALGAIPALINSRGAPEEMRYCVETVECHLVLSDLQRTRALAESGYTGPVIDVDNPAFAEALDKYAGASLPHHDGHVDDAAAILFTSGTTGKPKGAVLSHRAMLTGQMISQHRGTEFAMELAAKLGTDLQTMIANAPQGASLLIFPMFHISGVGAIFLSCIMRGDKIVIQRRWDADTALELVEREHVSAMSGPPSVIWDMVQVQKKNPRNLASLRSLGTGGQGLALNLLQAMQENFPIAVPGGGYGCTETAGAISLAMGEGYVCRPECSGVVHSLAQIKTIDDQGNDLPAGEVGELCVRGPMVMTEYWGRPDDTAKAIDTDGWLHTGDVGFVDAQGYITIVDRKTDMVISSGENIYCAEVERVLLSHPEIAEAAAFGVPDERLGERLMAAVVLHEGSSLGEDEIKAHVQAHLATYKVPAAVDVRPESLPRNVTGKVDKRRLRAAHDSI